MNAIIFGLVYWSSFFGGLPFEDVLRGGHAALRRSSDIQHRHIQAHASPTIAGIDSFGASESRDVDKTCGLN